MGKRQRDALLRLQAPKPPGPTDASFSKRQSRKAPPPTPTLPQAPAPQAEAPKPRAAFASPSLVDAEITDEMLVAAIRTLGALQRCPDVFRTARFKALRAAVYPLVQAPNTGHVARVSEALADERWSDAVLTLDSMRAAKDVPKLGAVQRWVRDCDLAGADNDGALLALDAILRTASPEQIRPLPTPPDVFAQGSIVLRAPEWSGVPLQAAPVPRSDLPDPAQLASRFSVLLREAAAQRRPPNIHDMILYRAEPGAIPMRPRSEVSVRRVEAPFAPCSFYLDGLLSPAEATSVVETAECVGFTPDEPLTGKKSVLAHHFVWMADSSFIGEVFERCRHLLPQSIGGAPLVGINGRLRCYRYAPGAVYRPHVDGAWPMSGVTPEGKYVYDVSEGAVTSKLTFLMYLNEGFEGGWTTYYTPAHEEGHLVATPVAPRIGGCMVFPHADTAGCLVHEGSGVLEGTKYIIRTEVLYRVGDSSKVAFESTI